MNKEVFLFAPNIIAVRDKDGAEITFYGELRFDEGDQVAKISPVILEDTGEISYKIPSKKFLRKWHKINMHYIMTLLLDEIKFRNKMKPFLSPFERKALKEAFESNIHFDLKMLVHNYYKRMEIKYE